jgi:hypothetical protein
MNPARRKSELIEANQQLRQRLEEDFEKVEPALQLVDNGIAAAQTAMELRSLASSFRSGSWTTLPKMILKNLFGRWG